VQEETVSTHVHGWDTHAHITKDDKIICKECKWEGYLSQCEKVPAGFCFETPTYYCPGKIFWFFKCGALLVIDGEEGGLRTMEKGGLASMARV